MDDSGEEAAPVPTVFTWQPQAHSEPLRKVCSPAEIREVEEREASVEQEKEDAFLVSAVSESYGHLT